MRGLLKKIFSVEKKVIGPNDDFTFRVFTVFGRRFHNRLLLGYWRALMLTYQIEENEILSKLLHETGDPAKARPTEGKRRKLQLANAELLRVFRDLCEKHGVTYWLNYGTLLGAVRHKGFIPWDDDLDVAVPHRDYERLFDLLKRETAGTRLKVYGVAEVMGLHTLRLSHMDVPLNLDVVPMYSTKQDVEKPGDRADIARRWREERKTMEARFHAERAGMDERGLRAFRGDVYDGIKRNLLREHACAVGESTSLINGLDSEAHFFRTEWVFPLGRLEFEGERYACPCDTDRYLREEYGAGYMGFPRRPGHHGPMFMHYDDGRIDGVIDGLKKIKPRA